MNTGVPIAAHHWGGILALLGIACLSAIGWALAVFGARGVRSADEARDPEEVRRLRETRRVTRRQDDMRFRIVRVALIIGGWVALEVIRELAFNDGRPPSWWWERILQNASWAWCAAAPAAIVGAVSIVLRKRVRPESTGLPIDALVCFRIVSRGLNQAALIDTVEAVRVAVQARSMFRYCIEVVVDNEVNLPPAADLTVHVVPKDYVTPNRSKYKARALHYSTEVSTLPPDAWVFHCDEESQVTPGLIGGIRDAVDEEEMRAAAGELPRIGQGTILYTRNLRSHPVMTLADSLRTGDDITRFATQFRSGMMFCGMHGSFILCRSDIECQVSFDVGPEGSITEDAWWAYEQSAHGVSFRWVDGYLLEQSPEHWKDFAKQRRRWYSGLWKVALYAPASAWARTALIAFLVTWLVSSIGGLYTFVNLFTGLTTPLPAQIVGGLVFSWYVNTYVTGLWIALRSMPAELRPSRSRCAALYVSQVLLMPVFGSLEAAGVLLAITKPETGFHVIKKSGSTGEGRSDDGMDAPGGEVTDDDRAQPAPVEPPLSAEPGGDPWDRLVATLQLLAEPLDQLGEPLGMLGESDLDLETWGLVDDTLVLLGETLGALSGTLERAGDTLQRMGERLDRSERSVRPWREESIPVEAVLGGIADFDAAGSLERTAGRVPTRT